MPLTPSHEWEETADAVIVRVALRRVNKKAIDVTVHDCYVKVTCPPHVWEADLKHHVDDLQSRYVVEDDCTVRIRMPKMTEGLVWEELHAEGSKAELRQRRADAEQRSQEAYNEKLQTRKSQTEKEGKRYFNEHWDLEKQTRKDIESKMKMEKQEVSDDLSRWAESVDPPLRPSNLVAAESASEQSQGVPPTLADAAAGAGNAGSAAAMREELERATEERARYGNCPKPKAAQPPADKASTAAAHTYDVGYKRWEQFDPDAEVDADGPDFDAAATYSGCRPGYVFRKGDQGLGYYRDTIPPPEGAKSWAAVGGPPPAPLPASAKAVLEKAAADAAKTPKTDSVAEQAAKRPTPALLDPSISKEEKDARWQTAAERYAAAQRGEIASCDRGKIFGAADTLPEPRETATVNIDFTPGNLAQMPQRQKDDDEIYRRSTYKPKNLQDTPLHFKELGDKQYAHKQWKAAADAYSEALKRDTTYMSALTNRILCWMRLQKYPRAIEDCNLALNLLQSMPASNTTSERFRAAMMKLHARRGAALCWSGKLREGLQDYQMAEGYSVGDPFREEIQNDLHQIKETMRERGMLTETEIHPLALRKSQADRLMSGTSGHKYQEAYDEYTSILEEAPDYWDVISNRVAACLYLRKFREAIEGCDRIIAHCQNVASALATGGVGQFTDEHADSDDEEDGISDGDSEEGANGEQVEDADASARKPRSERKRASATVKSNTSSVYMLLKAYVRKGSALAGLKDLRGAFEHYDLALRIVPYDEDLRWDCEQIRQKLQMNNVVAAATGKQKDLQ